MVLEGWNMLLGMRWLLRGYGEEYNIYDIIEMRCYLHYVHCIALIIYRIDHYDR